MARLRIRVELSRGGAGVPLHKLTSVIAASQKFLNFLTEDVRIEDQRGEWLAFDFDRESLNFTAEYVGAVTSHQVEAFNAAFDGTTSLRRDTIAHFLQITDAIGEDEVIGFGLYAEDTAEPSEWRCLSRRDALRIAEEVQVLMGAGEAPHLPAASDPSLGARMFGDRRDRLAQQNRLTEYVRQVEAGLSSRLDRVENQVQQHSGLIQDLHTRSSAAESSFRNLLTTFEGFCNQATLNIERMSPQAALPAPLLPQSSPVVRTKSSRSQPRGLVVATVGAVIAAAVVIGISFWPAHSGSGTANQQTPAGFKSSSEPATVSAASVDAAKVAPAKASTPANFSTAFPPPANLAAKPASQAPVVASAAVHAPNAALAAPAPSTLPAASPASTGPPMEVVLDATEPSWVSMKDEGGKSIFAQLLVPGFPRTVNLEGTAILRTGNAGGLAVRLNGNPIGSLGPAGKVREVVFKNGNFTIGSN